MWISVSAVGWPDRLAGFGEAAEGAEAIPESLGMANRKTTTTNDEFSQRQVVQRDVGGAVGDGLDAPAIVSHKFQTIS